MIGHLTNTVMFLSAAASGSLINAVAQGVILATAVAICLRFLPGIRPAARFVIWFSVLFTVLALHIIPGAADPLVSPLPANVASFHLDARWSLLIAAIWLALSLGRIVALIKSAVQLRHIARSAVSVASPPEHRHLFKTRFRSAQLCTSSQVDRPSVAGFFHPRILLPEDLLTKLSSQELEQIILHEMEHLRRYDDWTNLLQKVALILFPLNPVLLWVERRLCMERELACDDCVLNFTTARKTYALCLANLAEHSLLRRGVTLALGAWEKQSELARRIHRILGKPEAQMKPTTANLVTGVVLAGLLGGAFTLAHSPELVSFAPTASATAIAKTASTDSSVAVEASPKQSPVEHLAPTFVKAVMPGPQENPVRHRTTAHRKPQTVKTIHSEPQPQQRQWVILTHWQTTAVRQHPVFTVSETTGSSYAAVPVGSGWLIIQL